MHSLIRASIALLMAVAIGSIGAAQPTAATTLVLATEGSPPTFDPLLAGSDSRVNTPSINLYNALFQVSPGTTQVEPELAENYEIAEDGLSYTFTLRPGVLFHDGSEVTAEDVKYTIDRMLALRVGTYRNLGSIDSAEVMDTHVVRVNLTTPFPAMIQALTRLYILNASAVQANERDGDWGQTWLQNNEAGSGPYRLVSFQPEQQFTIEAFPEYFKSWHNDHVKRAIFRVIREESTRRLALARGEVDWISIGSADTYNEVRTLPEIEAVSSPTLNQLYFAFNTQHEHLSDTRIRQALALAYDYKGHAEIIRQGFADVARGPLPSGIPCFDESLPPSATDLERARTLLAEAGYPNGGFTIEMAYQGTSPEETAAMQLMQAGAGALGITVRPLAVEWPAKVDLFSEPGTAPAMGTIWIYPGYPDADVFLFPIGHSSQAGQLNFAYYRNDIFDHLIMRARSEQDAEARCDLYRQAQQIWVEDVPYANVVVGQTLSAWRNYVQGYLSSPSHALTVNVYPISLVDKPQ